MFLSIRETCWILINLQRNIVFQRVYSLQVVHSPGEKKNNQLIIEIASAE